MVAKKRGVIALHDAAGRMTHGLLSMHDFLPCQHRHIVHLHTRFQQRMEMIRHWSTYMVRKALCISRQGTKSMHALDGGAQQNCCQWKCLQRTIDISHWHSGVLFVLMTHQNEWWWRSVGCMNEWLLLWAWIHFKTTSFLYSFITMADAFFANKKKKKKPLKGFNANKIDVESVTPTVHV